MIRPIKSPGRAGKTRYLGGNPSHDRRRSEFYKQAAIAHIKELLSPLDRRKQKRCLKLLKDAWAAEGKNYQLLWLTNVHHPSGRCYRLTESDLLPDFRKIFPEVMEVLAEDDRHSLGALMILVTIEPDLIDCISVPYQRNH